MQIHAKPLRKFQNAGLENLPESGNDDQVGLQATEFFGKLRSAGSFRLENFQSGFLGKAFDRRSLELAASPFGPIRLGDDAQNLMFGSKKRFEGGQGKLGGSHIDDLHSFSRSFSIFLNLRRKMSRLIRPILSQNRMPFRWSSSC